MGYFKKSTTRKGRSQDQKNRSDEPHERGDGARRIGNPRYQPVTRKGKKVYVLRKRR